MIDKEFEDANFVGKDQPASIVALPFMEYFTRHAQNEFWQADGTLAKRLNQYHDFCKQPFDVQLLPKYFHGDWVNQKNADQMVLNCPEFFFYQEKEKDYWDIQKSKHILAISFAEQEPQEEYPVNIQFPVTDMNDFLSAFYSYSDHRFTFKPEYAAFFNLTNPR